MSAVPRADPGENRLQARTRRLAWPVCQRLWTINTSGFDRLPVDGPAILCPNHISFIDSIFLGFALPRNVSFVGKAEYLDSWKTKKLFPALGMIPIDRSGGSASQSALDAARRVLERGELFAIYPEGTRSRDGKLYKGRTGPARLAFATGAPIFPVGIVGTDEVQPIGAKFPRPRTECSITIGRPIRPERYAGRGPEHLAWRSMTDEVMFEIRAMTGQTYVDRYAGEAASDPVEQDRPATVANVSEDKHLVSAG